MGPKGEKGEPGAPSPYGVSVGVSITSSFLSWYRPCKLLSRANFTYKSKRLPKGENREAEPSPFETEFHASE